VQVVISDFETVSYRALSAVLLPSDIGLLGQSIGLFLARAARQAFWNLAGVEPIHWKLAHIDPGSRVSGTNRERSLFRSQWYKANKRRDTGSKTRQQEASWAV